MKYFQILLLLMLVSSCKKDCSGDVSANADFIEVKKTSTGICVKNKFILPIHVKSIGISINGSTNFDVKILSGLSHTFKFSDMDYIKKGNSSDNIKTGLIKYRRESCDYGERQTILIGYHEDYYWFNFQ